MSEELHIILFCLIPIPIFALLFGLARRVVAGRPFIGSSLCGLFGVLSASLFVGFLCICLFYISQFLPELFGRQVNLAAVGSVGECPEVPTRGLSFGRVIVRLQESPYLQFYSVSRCGLFHLHEVVRVQRSDSGEDDFMTIQETRGDWITLLILTLSLVTFGGLALFFRKQALRFWRT